MSKDARNALLIVLAAVSIIVIWILFRSPLGTIPQGGNVRVFNTIGPYDVTFSDFAAEAEGPAGATHELREDHIEIEGVTPTLTPSPQFEIPYLSARPLGSALCRTGPRVCDPPLTYLIYPQVLPLDGRNLDGSWLRLLLLPTDLTCWVWADGFDVNGDVTLVPEISPEPQPCPIPSPADQPQGCWIVDALHPNGFCRTGSCTPNDFPGTSCTLP